VILGTAIHFLAVGIVLSKGSIGAGSGEMIA
jgi:hypothetical protein